MSISEPANPALVAGPVEHERADLRLGRNLILARMATEMTQEALAEAAGLARATIAQIESGRSDPRLSTVTELAAALGISPLLLLLGPDALEALATLVEERPHDPLAGHLSAADRERMRRLIESGFSKSRLQAVRIALAAGRAAGMDPAALVGAGIGVSLKPDTGAALVAALADRLGRPERPRVP